MSTISEFRERLVGSPCCLPAMSRKDIYAAYQKLGFTKFEAFSTWAAAHHDWKNDPAAARKEAAAYGLNITSYHLPQISEDLHAGLADALGAARFAAGLGSGVAVLFKAQTREIFAQVARPFLDALDAEGLDVVPVLQNHRGSAITTLEDYREVLESIGDPRMKAILEVGHFQRVGTHWSEGWDLLGDRIALLHVNDIRGGESVHFGTGEVDFAGLLARVKQSGFAGNIVVELELATRSTDPDATLSGLAGAITHLCDLYENA